MSHFVRVIALLIVEALELQHDTSAYPWVMCDITKEYLQVKHTAGKSRFGCVAHCTGTTPRV